MGEQQLAGAGWFGRTAEWACGDGSVGECTLARCRPCLRLVGGCCNALHPAGKPKKLGSMVLGTRRNDTLTLTTPNPAPMRMRTGKLKELGSMVVANPILPGLCLRCNKLQWHVTSHALQASSRIWATWCWASLGCRWTTSRPKKTPPLAPTPSSFSNRRDCGKCQEPAAARRQCELEHSSSGREDGAAPAGGGSTGGAPGTALAAQRRPLAVRSRHAIACYWICTTSDFIGLVMQMQSSHVNRVGTEEGHEAAAHAYVLGFGGARGVAQLQRGSGDCPGHPRHPFC